MNRQLLSDLKNKLQTKEIRAEVVGSMLRTNELLNGRELHKKKELSDVEFKIIEDRAVEQCLAFQEEAGVDIVTDGEVRRDVFASQLAQASEGFGVVKDNWVNWFDQKGNVQKDPVTLAVIGKIKRKRHLSAEEFCFIRGKTKKPIKVTLPSPTMLAYYWLPGTTDKVYASPDDFLKDVSSILNDEVAELIRLGATYIQFDAPEFGMLIDEHQREWFKSKGFDPDQLILDGIMMMNKIIDQHPGITFGLHICRGNDKSRYMAKGDYSKVAQLIFPRTHAQRLLLEFDDERSGDFAPLQLVPKDKIVVLGLITTKTNRQESADELKARIEEASQFIPKERLALSTQCGFASVAKGNTIDFPTQFKKLKLVADVAHEVWGDQTISSS
ncbi:MAG TPA: cobalamin-independent methionine synthase II family protein [Candidatus Nanoarchaeia archaeon]|nr:cobalamin-independent methionine synthase II family protein [Candidatus Nanoarchaeia archaeon]